MQFGPLRVLNEDVVAPLTGFGKHPHREYEIFSYVVSGELEHKDSLGNTEVLSRGHVQLTSTGTGISHSEKTHGKKNPVHFLQIWSVPVTRGLQPKYYTRWFGDEEKKRGWVRVVDRAWGQGVEPNLRDGHRKPGEGDEEVDSPAPVQTALTMYATLLPSRSAQGSESLPDDSVASSSSRDLALKGTKAYVHVVQTSGYNAGPAAGASIRISELSQRGESIILREGDGAYVQVLNTGCPGGAGGVVLKVENVGEIEGEVLVFDLD